MPPSPGGDRLDVDEMWAATHQVEHQADTRRLRVLLLIVGSLLGGLVALVLLGVLWA